MSHLLKTINPEAAAAMTAADAAPVMPLAPLPGIGESVVFYPRPGELRAGRGRHAAIVTAVNEDDRTLDLVVIYDADDFIGQRHVPARSLDGGMGWEARSQVVVNRAPQEIESLRAEVAALRALIVGDFDEPEQSIVSVLAEHDDRLDAFEAARKPMPRRTRAKAKAKVSSKPAAKAKAEGK